MLDKAAHNLYIWIREYSPPPFPVLIAGFAAMAGFLLMTLGVYQGGFQASNVIGTLDPAPRLPPEWLAVLPRIFGEFFSQSIVLIVIGVCVVLSGRALRWFFEHDSRLFRTVVIVVVVGWSSQIFYEASQILITPTLSYERLVIGIVIGIFLTIASFFITMALHRKYNSFFQEKETESEES